MPVKQIKVMVDAQGNECRAFEARMDIEDGKLRGYAAVFDQLSLDLGGWKERIRRGAFSKHLATTPDVRALWQHDRNYVLGRTKASTLELVEDIHGLRSLIDPPDTQWARDAVTTIKRGDVDQMSFGFYTDTDEWNMEDGELVRTVIDARLFDVSPVTFPAYEGTSISARSITRDIVVSSSSSARLANMRRRLELLNF
jgi:HK97 family phage prohead protease